MAVAEYQQQLYRDLFSMLAAVRIGKKTTRLGSGKESISLGLGNGTSWLALGNEPPFLGPAGKASNLWI